MGQAVPPTYSKMLRERGLDRKQAEAPAPEAIAQGFHIVERETQDADALDKVEAATLFLREDSELSFGPISEANQTLSLVEADGRYADPRNF